MLAPEIEAREAAKTLDLLRYALVHERVDPRRYAIAIDPAGLGPGDDQFQLTQNADGWEIFYIERGQRSDIACFANVRDAAKHLFMALTDPTSFYRHRPAWERETGQEFSMIA